MIVDSLLELIGDTPLLRINPEKHGIKGLNLYVKLELLNPFGSIKDRTALALLSPEVQRGDISGKTIIESSSGNTAKALGLIAHNFGLEVESVTSRSKVPEVSQLLQILGIKLIHVPGMSECPDPRDPYNPLKFIESRILQNPDVYFSTDQYVNPKNPAVHANTTAREIEVDIGIPDYFFSGIGTSGSSGGVATYFHSHDPRCAMIGTIAHSGEYIPGIRSESELTEVPLYDRSKYQKLIAKSARESALATLDFVRVSGVPAGPTTGAVYATVRQYFQDSPIPDGETKTAVMIACDRIEPYVSYFRKYTPEILGQELTGLSVFERTKEQDLCPITWEAFQATYPHGVAIDLRGPDSYQNGHISQTICLSEEYLESMTQWGSPFDINTPLLFCCPVGERSDRVAGYFVSQGYRAYSLQGGIRQYLDQGGLLQRCNIST